MEQEVSGTKACQQMLFTHSFFFFRRKRTRDKRRTKEIIMKKGEWEEEGNYNSEKLSG